MKETEFRKIMYSFLCIVLFAAFFIAGFIKWVFFIPAIAFIVIYIFIDRKYLRCPHCGGFTNLDRLYYAVNHSYHCSHCGEIIKIKR